MASHGSGEEKESIFSMKEVDTVLRTEYGQYSPYHGADVSGLDPKKKLQLFAATAYLGDKLEKASPEEVQAMVNSGLFKGLCSMMAVAPEESEEANTVMSVCANRLTSFVEVLPDLAAKTWSYGAVRPVTDVVKRNWDLTRPVFLENGALKAALALLEAMGKPCHHEHTYIVKSWGNKPTPQSDAKRTASKLYKWLLKEGVIDAIARIWGALADFGEDLIEGTNYKELVSLCGSVLWYAHVVHKKSLAIATRADLVKPVFHFVMAEVSALQDTRQVALALLYNLWLNDMNDYSKVPDAVKIRQRIARHPNVRKLMTLLGEHSESPDKEPRLSSSDSLIPATFVGLLRLLSFDPSTRPPRQALRIACHLLAVVDDPVPYPLTLDLVACMGRTGKLTLDDLLAHAFPGFLRGFATEVARRHPATCQPEVDLLTQMLGFLLSGFALAHQKVSADIGKPFGDELLPIRLAMPPEKWPKLVQLMVETRAAAALAALSGSRYSVQSNVAVRSVAEAARDDAVTLKPLLEQMMPALVLSILEEGADRDRRRQSFMLLRLLGELVEKDADVRFGTISLVLGNRPGGLGVLERPGVFAKYFFESNRLFVDEALVMEKGNVLLGFIKEMQTGPFQMDAEGAARLQREFDGTGAATACGVCGKELETLKRCARCRQAEYCGAECQAKDWPRHKEACKSKATEKQRDRG